MPKDTATTNGAMFCQAADKLLKNMDAAEYKHVVLVLASDQTTPINDFNPFVEQPQANLWFGKTDDLWQLGKPQGCGGPWLAQPVAAGEASHPYLTVGFGPKVLHLSHEFPTGLYSHWVWLVSGAACTATAIYPYT